MADAERPFSITVRRQWTLWILPIVAAAYFLAVVVLNAMNYRIRGVSEEMLVLAGVGLFVLVILVELPFLKRRRAPRAPKAKAARTEATMGADSSRNGWDDELLTTSENQQGLLVVEYSAPAKSRNANAVYTKTYVPVTGAHVLRVETLVADQADI